jgi:hypothetical protein
MPETGQVRRRPAMQELCDLKRAKTIDELVTAAELRLGHGDEERWNTYV